MTPRYMRQLANYVSDLDNQFSAGRDVGNRIRHIARESIRGGETMWFEAGITKSLVDIAELCDMLSPAASS